MAFTLVCPCGFESQDAQAFADHVAGTQHLGSNLAVVAESGDLASMIEAFSALQVDAELMSAGGPIPVGVRPMSREDIETDDDLSEEDKALILSRLDMVEARIREGVSRATDTPDEPSAAGDREARTAGDPDPRRR